MGWHGIAFDKVSVNLVSVLADLKVGVRAC